MPLRHSASRSTWELKAIFAFGVLFVIVVMLIAITHPRPTEFQQTIFRIVLSLAAAGVAALVPGFLTIRYKNILRAGGAMAVFVLVYFFNPATLVIKKSPFPTDQFKITILIEQQGELVANSYDFPISDIRRKASGADFLELLTQLPNLPARNLQPYTVFRISDEKTITADSGNVLDDKNAGVLVIPEAVISTYDNEHFCIY